jgi:hypothetical protein
MIWEACPVAGKGKDGAADQDGGGEGVGVGPPCIPPIIFENGGKWSDG